MMKAPVIFPVSSTNRTLPDSISRFLRRSQLPRIVPDKGRAIGPETNVMNPMKQLLCQKLEQRSVGSNGTRHESATEHLRSTLKRLPPLAKAILAKAMRRPNGRPPVFGDIAVTILREPMVQARLSPRRAEHARARLEACEATWT